MSARAVLQLTQFASMAELRNDHRWVERLCRVKQACIGISHGDYPEMSDNPLSVETALSMVRELRELLLDYVAGGPARAPRYKVLRDALVGDDRLRDRLPSLVVEYENLVDLWQFLKYQSSSKVERQELVRQQFDAVARALSGASPSESGSGQFAAITTDKLFKGWYRLSQDEMEPQRLLATARKITVQVCCSIVDAHYNSREIRGGNEELSQVFGMTQDVLLAISSNNDKQLIVADVIAGAAALRKTFDAILERLGQTALDPDEQRRLARMGVDAMLSAAMSLLSCWYMLQSGSSPRGAA